MANAFVSYSGEDCELVKELVCEVEREGHRLWYFERDSMPASVYLSEIAAAITRCDFMILVVSRASLDSHQVTKEIEQAHQQNKRILPLLYQVTANEMRSIQPLWAAALGATVHVHVDDSDVKSVVREILRVCKALHPDPGPITNSWAADGQLIDISQLERVVVQTPAIEAFIRGNDQYFISANKGVGKTLLLKFKRSQLMTEHAGRGAHARSEVAFIPEGRPYLDFMGGELPSLKKGHIEFLSTLRNCRRLWSFALRASILSHFPDHFASLDAERFAECASIPLHELIPENTAATAVFNSLLSLSVTDMNRILDKLDNHLEYAFRRIHSAAFTFIDRVEQGISNLPQDAWIHIQAGLIEAAWDVMSSNNHVKIYATIREEAYANYGSDSKNNLYSATLPLRYSLSELRDMIDRLTVLYESSSGFQHFVGINEVNNLHCNLMEDSFMYLLRHTVGRPRDLVIVCSQLSRSKHNLDGMLFREIVNEASARNIVTNVFHEMTVFLNCLSTQDERNRFFSLIPCNILTRDQLEEICCRFNGLDDVRYSELHECSETISHPFCELYNCGLIGTVRDDPAQGDVQQQFKQPYDLMNCRECCLPKADYYLLHPALQSLIHRQRSGSGYHTFRFVAVGHKYPWRGHHGELVDLQQAMLDMSDSELRHRVFRFIEKSLSPENGRPNPGQLNDAELAQIQEELERKQFDDVYLLLDKYLNALKVNAGTF